MRCAQYCKTHNLKPAAYLGVIPHEESMSFKLRIIIGSLIVMVASCLTMIASEPKVYSPYSLSVVIPALIFSSKEMGQITIGLLASVPTLLLYLIFSITSIKPKYTISKPTIGMAVTLVILSVAFNIHGYQYGIKYQGTLHTHLMYAYNLVLLSLLSAVYFLNFKKPNAANCLGFNVILFSWFGWVAFPWLGELI
jgi:hypothetical protein